MGMQMPPQGPNMPPMGYQTHGMPPNVSYYILFYLIITLCKNLTKIIKMIIYQRNYLNVKLVIASASSIKPTMILANSGVAAATKFGFIISNSPPLV